MSAATTIAACAKAIANAWKAFCMAVDVKRRQIARALYPAIPGDNDDAKTDWQRPGNSPRDLDNILDNYMGWIPVSGETLYYFQTNLGLTERTNAVPFVWP